MESDIGGIRVVKATNSAHSSPVKAPWYLEGDVKAGWVREWLSFTTVTVKIKLRPCFPGWPFLPKTTLMDKQWQNRTWQDGDFKVRNANCGGYQMLKNRLLIRGTWGSPRRGDSDEPTWKFPVLMRPCRHVIGFIPENSGFTKPECSHTTIDF